jgi:hypothetical protein
MKIEKYYRLQRQGWSNNMSWNLNTTSWNTHDFIEQTDVNKIKTFVGNIKETMPTLKPKTNILIDKNSDVPRNKLKEFINDNNYKKVTLLSKADVIIIKRETVKMMMNWDIKTLDKVNNNDIKSINGNMHGMNVWLYPNNTHDTGYQNVLNNCSKVTGWLIDGYRNKKQNESLEFIYSLIGTKATVVYDDAIVGTLNKDGLDLDNDIYDTLSGMMLAKDTATFNLGIEMLSNINVENNLFKISLIMNDTFNKTSRLNSLSQYNNKNFKSLLTYLSANKIRWNQNWEVFGMSMYNKFKDTEHKLFIKKYLIDNINDRFKKLCVNDSIEILEIIFKEN